MSDRSVGDFIGGGLTATLFLVYLPKILKWLVQFLPRAIFGFFGLIFFGLILNIFTGHMDDFRGPVKSDQIEVKGYASLDHLSVVVTNNSDHPIDLLDMTCNGHNVHMRRMEPNESREFSRFAGNISQGIVTCQVDKLKS